MSPASRGVMILIGLIILGIGIWTAVSATSFIIWTGGIIVGLILIGKGIFSSD